ncbi:Fur family transcriptional regulator [Fusibacter tunisiensis]|uniref:Fe2+ or Zn2+ uptake regulation protein n=1 Tax=Fusibacter tunisiensis TaxID=1008308 RepID=A0ABS2MR55_9FIRM|nr:transcriptional repressor [Fusibacter tunisiensis]MBM7561856.1 Fe2+ or Zn2+ uptake regulation protein [Fusibacter tunisiensis]
MQSASVIDFFKAHGIKPSFQRIKIYEYLLSSKEHPTVDVIYSALNSEIPTLSKTTVYNTLKVFIEKGIAMAITIDENEVRYDAEMRVHGHFKCEMCQKIYDFDVDIDHISGEALNDFDIYDQQMFFYGVCKKCKKNA